MSHAAGTVTFSDGHVMHYEYYGTSDWCSKILYDTKDEMLENWRNHDDQKECTCSRDENVEIYTEYGYGSSWNGKACRFCKVITQGRNPYPYEEDDYTWGYGIIGSKKEN